MSGQTVAGDPVALVTYTDATTPTLEPVASSMEAVIRARDAFVQAPSMAPLDVHDVSHLLEPALARLEVTDRIPGAVGAALAELDGAARFVGSVGAAQRHVTVRDGERFDQLAAAYLLALLEGEPLPGGDDGGLTALQLLGVVVTAVGGTASRDEQAVDALVTAALARAGSDSTVPAGTWKVVRRGANALGVVLVGVEEWRSHDALSTPGQRVVGTATAAMIEGGAAAFGSSAGAVLGQATIPAPGVGAAVGSVAGGYVGGEFGSWLRGTEEVAAIEADLAERYDALRGTGRDQARYDELLERSRTGG